MHTDADGVFRNGIFDCTLLGVVGRGIARKLITVCEAGRCYVVAVTHGRTSKFNHLAVHYAVKHILTAIYLSRYAYKVTVVFLLSVFIEVGSIRAIGTKTRAVLIVGTEIYTCCRRIAGAVIDTVKRQNADIANLRIMEDDVSLCILHILLQLRSLVTRKCSAFSMAKGEV